MAGSLAAAAAAVGAILLSRKKKEKSAPRGMTPAQIARMRATQPVEYEGISSTVLMGVGVVAVAAAGIGGYLLLKKPSRGRNPGRKRRR